MVKQNKEQETPTILIADDSPTALKVTSSVLRKAGYKTILATDGEQAVYETLKHRPSAVVVDLKMPKMDGYEVCMELKRDKRLYFPILLLTAREDIESMVKGLESGADDYIVKPFIEMEFIARIKVLLRLKRLHDELLHANRKLKYLSTHDELSKLFNHRYFIHMLDKLLSVGKEQSTNLCLAIFDVDFFKKVNDSYGHLEGDAVLRKLATHLAGSFTSDTILARYGGEEFAALFPNKDVDFVITACQKVIEDCPRLLFKHADTEYRITMSAGVCSTDCINSYNPGDLIQAADQLLYESKNNGRNRLSFHKK